MTEVIVFTPAELVAVAHLSEVLNVPVSTRVPATRPPSYVRVVRTGGGRESLVTDRAQLTVEAWAPTELEAAQLAELARAQLFATAGELIGDTWVNRVGEVGGPAYSPDPASETPRYVFTVLLITRGSVL